MPTFFIKKEVYEWIKLTKKTVELRKGKPRNGEKIAFLSGRNKMIRGRILRKREGKLEELLNIQTYKKIVPCAKNLEEAKAFIKKIYPSTEDLFTAYEFEVETKKPT